MKHTKWTTRLAVLLCIAMVLPMFLTVGSVEANAKQISSRWAYQVQQNYSSRSAKMIVEQGQKFVLSDWFTVDGKNTMINGSELKGLKYTNSSKKVATISSKTGVLTTKKKGTTKITIKSPKNGVDLKLTLQVVGKKSLTKQVKNGAAYQKGINDVLKKAGKKVTDQNFDAVFDSIMKAETSLGSGYKKLSGGVIKKGYKTTNKVAIPQYRTYYKYNRQLCDLIGKAKTVEADTLTIDSATKTAGITYKNTYSLKAYLKALYSTPYSSIVNDGYTYGAYPNYVAYYKAGKPEAQEAFLTVNGQTLQIKYAPVIGTKAGTVELVSTELPTPGTYLVNSSDLGKITVIVK